MSQGQLRSSAKTGPLRIVCCVLVSFVFLVAIDHNLAYAQTAKPARFVEEIDWPPFTPGYEGMTKEGLSYDLISAVFRQIKIPVTLEIFPQKRVLRLLKRGERDGAIVISKNADREKYITFSTPIFQKTWPDFL